MTDGAFAHSPCWEKYFPQGKAVICIIFVIESYLESSLAGIMSHSSQHLLHLQLYHDCHGGAESFAFTEST